MNIRHANFYDVDYELLFAWKPTRVNSWATGEMIWIWLQKYQHKIIRRKNPESKFVMHIYDEV
jgi:hypothetical protein